MGCLFYLIAFSIGGTILWLLLLVLRPLTEKIFSQTWHYYVSLIPLFFLLGGALLLLPVIRTVGTALTAIPAEATSAIAVTPAAIIATENNVKALQLFLKQISLQSDSNDFALYLALLYGFGFFVFLAVQIKNYLLFKNKIQNENIYVDVVSTIFNSASTKNTVRVIKTSAVTSPLLFGIWRPVIALPDFEFSKPELAVIIEHEMIHTNRGDLPFKLCVMFANAVHWFNPLLYLFNRDVEALCERSCDEQLVSDLDSAGRKFYGETILSVLSCAAAQKGGIYVGFGSKKKIKRRLSAMLNFKKTKGPLTALSVAVALVITGFGSTVAFAMSDIIERTETPWYEQYKEMKMIAAEEIYINGEELKNLPAFYQRNIPESGGVFEENIYIPLRATAEKLGLALSWDKASGTATIGGIALKAGETPKDYLGITPQLFGDYLYVAPDFFTRVLGAEFEMTFGAVDKESPLILIKVDYMGTPVKMELKEFSETDDGTSVRTYIITEVESLAE